MWSQIIIIKINKYKVIDSCSGILIHCDLTLLYIGESGVGKSAIINHMLHRLGQEGGASTKSGTVLGQILSYSDKSNALLESISKLTEMDNTDESKNIDVLLGTAKPKSTTGIISSMIQFSAQTTSARLKAHIMHKLIKKGKDTMGAPRGRKVLVFVDDLNMPAPEVYGAQPPLELLRQFLELGGFYHAGKTHLVWKVCDYWHDIDEACNIT